MTLIGILLGFLSFFPAVSIRSGINQHAPEGETVRVEILFIRHGNGCHNMLNSAHWSDYPNPPLSDCGVANSKKNGAQLRQALKEFDWVPDIVASSSLRRAIETAALMFPRSGVVAALPFITEVPATYPANRPQTIDASERVYGSRVDASHIKEVRELRDELLRADTPAIDLYRDYFKPMLASKILKTIIEQEQAAVKSDIKLVVVSHYSTIAAMMKESFGCGDVQLLNNMGIFGAYAYNIETQSLDELNNADDSRSCTMPLGLAPLAAGWAREGEGCPADYAVCYENGGAAYMGAESGVSPWVGPVEEEELCCTDDD